jgi:hypothetical protein
LRRELQSDADEIDLKLRYDEMEDQFFKTRNSANDGVFQDATPFGQAPAEIDEPAQKKNQLVKMQLVLTKKPDYKAGIKMPVEVYEAMKNEIMKLLHNEEMISLPSLFAILHPRFFDMLGEDTGWYLYHVKLDLQTRGAIKVEFKKRGRNVLTLLKIARVYKRSRIIL